MHKNYIFNEKKVQIMLFIKYNVIILLKITQTINPRVWKTSTGKAMPLSNCELCNSKNQDLILGKKQMGKSEISKIKLAKKSKLESKTPLNKIPLLDDI